VWTTEAVYVTADGARLRGEPRSIQQIAAAQLVLPEALAGDEDPTRRRLRDRATDADVRLEPVVEVESPAAALDLVVRGVGDSVIARRLIEDLGLTDRLTTVPLDPPLLEKFAFITPRGAPTSAAMAAWIAIVEQHLALDLL
jgi:DNA-binding transcriptional LysR family regulator